MPHLRQLAAAAWLNHARSIHTTDVAAILTAAVGFIAVLGWREFAWALLPGGAMFWLGPAALEPLVGPRRLGRYAARADIRPPARGRAATRPSQLLLLHRVAVHGTHALGVVWFVGRAMWVAGAIPPLAVLAVAAAVFEVPRLLLPLVFGRQLRPGTRVINHVLLQRSDVIGDLVMATPCIRSIQAASPGCRVSVLCRASTSELLRGHPRLEAVIVDPTVTGQRQAEGWHASALGALVGRLRHRGIDAVVSLWDRPSSVYPLAAMLARIPVRGGNLRACGGWLLNAGARPSEGGIRHEVEQDLFRVRALGFDAEADPRLSIALTGDNVERARLMLTERDIGADEFLVGLSPATSGTNRRLEPATYARFAQRVRRSHGARTLLLGGERDRALTAAIMAEAPAGTVDLAGQTSVGLLAAIIARCRVHVGCDSGPAHVAAALGVPGVVVSPARSQKPLQWGPWMASHRIVRKRPACRVPCFPSACREDSCVRAITADDVWEAFNRVAAGDAVVEPLAGRRYWAALSLAVLVHAPDDGRRAEVMSTLALLRRAGFIEFIVACRPGGVLDEEARAEGFETRVADAASFFAAIVEFGGGVVYDFATSETRQLRLARWVAAAMGSRTRRVAAGPVPNDAAALTDTLLEAAR
jgi:ADP-heptose:LPS heptosyltransferase